MLYRFRQIIVLFLGCFAAVSSQAQSGLGIHPPTFDFGWAPQNATLVCQVWVVAPAGDTISLGEIKTGCGCLVVIPEPAEIPPGDSLTLSCYWQTRGSVGTHNVSAYLYTTPDQRPVELTIEGKVVTEDDSIASIDWSPRRVEFGRATGIRNNRTEKVITLTNVTDTELAVALVGQGPELGVALLETIPAGQTAQVQVAILGAHSGIDFESSFTLEFSGNASESFRVSIPVVSGDFSFRPDFTTTKK